MKVCPSCKGQYDENMRFCRKCGVSLISDKASSPNVIAKRHVFETKISQEPGNTYILVEYGDYLLSVGLIDDALIQYFKAVEMKAADETVRMKIAEAYHSSKQYDNAITQLLIIMEARPKDIALKEKLYSIYLEAEKLSDAAELLRQLHELEPSNLNHLVRRLEILHKKPDHDNDEVLNICRVLHHEKPFHYPICNLYIGISLSEEARANNNQELCVQAEELLKNAFSSIAKFNSEEKLSYFIYFYWNKLKLNRNAFEILQHLKEIDKIALTKTQKEILSDCLLMIGNAQLQAGMFDEATESYKSSHSYLDTSEVRNRLAMAYMKIGNQLHESGKYSKACNAFQNGLSYQQDDTELKSALENIRTKINKKTLIISACSAFAAILVIICFIYYNGQSALKIECNQVATISINNGDELIESKETNVLQTPFMRKGLYIVKINKEGFEPINDEINLGFGREVKNLKYNLKPKFIAKKNLSEPSKTSEIEKNNYTEKTKNITNSTPSLLENTATIPVHRVGDTYTTEVLKLGEQKPIISTERRVVSVNSNKITVESMSLLSKKKTVRVLEYTSEWNLVRTLNPNDGDLDLKQV